MMRRLSTGLLILTLTACQPQVGGGTPVAGMAQSTGSHRVTMTLHLLVPALRTQAASSDINHLTLKLYDPGDLVTVKGQTTVAAPAGATVTASFSDLPDGPYKLTVQAMSAANETSALSSVLTSSNTATVAGGAVTYGADPGFTFATALQLISGGTWSATISGPYSTRYDLALVNQATRAVVGRYSNTVATVVARNLPDGIYDIWAAVASATLATPMKRTGAVTVSGAGATVTVTGSVAVAATVDSVIPTAGLSNPAGVAVDGAGALYVVNSGNNTLTKLTPVAAVPGTYTQSTIPTTGLSGPKKVAVDGAGALYVTSQSNGTLIKLTPVAAVPGTYTQSTIPIVGIINPAGVAVDGAGALYVTNINNNTLTKLTPVPAAPGTYTQSIVPTTGLSGPAGVVVDGAGAVYVVNYGSNTLTKLTPVPAVPGTYTQKTVPTVGLSGPFGVAVDGAGVLYVANYNNATLSKVE